MRKLSEMEILSLSGILKIEKDGLVVSKALQELISDEDLAELAEANIFTQESRIKTIQQFINENQITTVEGGY
ncbi:hypothetical protein EDC18_103418 [Natranaerovirga pectinivora]|uniref:Uncharacterized protein n=1 Tax=Natranaerovirga pectinivora TaxID=682400 RepID=A0A4R3MSC7_9FIRM|nr:hypothetical protein [Natranaerovirga pectinivora]TCT15707.1 hypothetical protein EDC18_103418 [Natranaerovirga pectinivora]